MENQKYPSPSSCSKHLMNIKNIFEIYLAFNLMRLHLLTLKNIDIRKENYIKIMMDVSSVICPMS